jgi:hypothetical protein
LILFPLKLTQPTLICGGGSEVGKWWNVEGTYLEEGREGECSGRGRRWGIKYLLGSRFSIIQNGS